MTVQTNPVYIEDKGYTARIDRQVIQATTGPGVVNPTDLAPSTTGAAARTIQVAKGAVFVAGTQNVDQGTYRVFNDANLIITLAAAVTSPRLDQIVARVYDATENGGVGADNATIEIVQGVETAGATNANRAGAVADASLPANCYVIADVLVPVGASPAIPSGNVVDRRSSAFSISDSLVAGGAALQTGVVGNTDGVITSAAVSSAGVLSGTIAGGMAWVATPSGLLVQQRIPSVAFSIAPSSLPATSKIAAVGVDLVAQPSGQGWMLALTAKGIDQTTAVLALNRTNTPALVAGHMRLMDIAILNTSGVYSLSLARDRRPRSAGFIDQVVDGGGGTGAFTNTGVSFSPMRLEGGAGSVYRMCVQINIAMASVNDVVFVTIHQDGNGIPAGTFSQQAVPVTTGVEFVVESLVPLIGSSLFTGYAQVVGGNTAFGNNFSLTAIEMVGRTLSNNGTT